MKCLNLHAVGDLRYEEIEKPRPKSGEALVKIRASGICGSDIQRVFDKGTYHFPTVIGHEFAGEIVECADKSLLGARAAIFPLLPCFKCPACAAERFAQCSDYDYFGSRRDGGMAEYIAVPTFNLVLAPDSVSYEELAMTEPCAVAHRALIQGGLKSGQSVAVFGAGPIGLMIAKWAHVLGAGQILLVDIDKRKVKFAQDAGFECVDGSACDAAAELVRLTGGKGPDTTIEGTGTGAAFAQALRAAAPFGTVVAMGNPVGDMNIPQKAYWEILRKQLNVCGTWNSRYGSRENDWREAVDAMSTGKIDLKPLISHRFPLSAGIKPFELMRGRTEFTNKILFTL